MSLGRRWEQLKIAFLDKTGLWTKDEEEDDQRLRAALKHRPQPTTRPNTNAPK
jgi:hypothetical protein